MEIWAHTLVKNEALWLWYSVSSVINHVDKLMLWDTGSTDESLEIEKELVKKYPEKIIFKKRMQTTSEEFEIVRQEMLDVTKSDWFLMLDADEIWWEDSIKTITDEIRQANLAIESVVVPTINLVGDIFHYQEKSAGKYKFGERVGHYNLRAIRRNISGLHSQGFHGIWGWADSGRKMIQDRNSYKFINTPYLHATNLRRSEKDSGVIKRSKKLKYEIGIEFPKDFYYPEAFFKDRPELVKSPWTPAEAKFKFRAFFETPVKRLKRKALKGRVGY